MKDPILRNLMRLSKKSRWIILLASAPLVCVTFYLLLWPVPEDPPAPRYLSVSFAGYTNDASGRVLAEFSLSNLRAFRIDCSYIGPQVLITNRSRMATNIVWSWQPGWTSRSLQPREVAMIRVVPPTNSAPWQFGVFVTRPSTPLQNAIDKLEPHLPTRIYRLLRGDPRRTQLIQCPVVEARENAGAYDQ